MMARRRPTTTDVVEPPLVSTIPFPQGSTNDLTVDSDVERSRIVRLRSAGDSLESIAAATHLSPATVFRQLAIAVKEKVQADAADLAATRMEEVARIEVLLEAYLAPAADGDTAACDRVLKLLDHKATYLGLDTPAKNEVDPNAVKFLGSREEMANSIWQRVLHLTLTTSTPGKEPHDS